MNNSIPDLDDVTTAALNAEPPALTPESDMADVMDALAFDYDAVPTAWDAEGNVVTVDNPVVGTPGEDAQFWQPQTTPFTCAVVAQRGIIEAFTGEPISEAQLVYDATANGWLSDGGMSPLDVGNLLELYNIPCHVDMGATVEDLMAELTQGHKVIVGVDAGELWDQDFPLEDFFEQSADHAIWVTGVDMSDPDNPMVIINDSGKPEDGAGNAYPLADFVDAWEDSGFYYVATDNAPPDFHQLAAGFDPESGLFTDIANYIGGLYSDFVPRIQPEVHSESAAQSAPPTADNPFASLGDAEKESLFKSI